MQLKGIELLITTYCNFSCDQCSQAIPVYKDPRHMSWEQVLAFAAVSRDISTRRFSICGGEPLLSPIFPKIASHMRELFAADYYELRTNGTLLHEHLGTIAPFDKVVVGYYPRRSPDRIKLLPSLDRRIRLYLNTRFWNMQRPHSSRLYGEPWKRCGFYGWINVVQDRIYPCCNMHGISVYRSMLIGDASVPVQEDWVSALGAMDMAPLCRECPWPN